MMRTPDGHSKLELTRYHVPAAGGAGLQFENIFLLCYLRGPAGIIVALAEQIG